MNKEPRTETAILMTDRGKASPGDRHRKAGQYQPYLLSTAALSRGTLSPVSWSEIEENIRLILRKRIAQGPSAPAQA